jgi:hypothetical protein
MTELSSVVTADDEGRANVLDKAAGSGESFADHMVWASSIRPASPPSALLRPSVAVGAFFLESQPKMQPLISRQPLYWTFGPDKPAIDNHLKLLARFVRPALLRRPIWAPLPRNISPTISRTRMRTRTKAHSARPSWSRERRRAIARSAASPMPASTRESHRACQRQG